MKKIKKDRAKPNKSDYDKTSKQVTEPKTTATAVRKHKHSHAYDSHKTPKLEAKIYKQRTNM